MDDNVEYSIYSIQSKHFGNFEFYPLFGGGEIEPAFEHLVSLFAIYFPPIPDAECSYFKIAKPIINEALQELESNKFYIYAFCNRNIVFHKFIDMRKTGEFYDFVKEIDELKDLPACNQQFYEIFTLKKI